MKFKQGFLLVFRGLLLIGLGKFVFAGEGKRSHFLSNGPQSIGGSIGNAMTAYPQDAGAVYWNPAGLVGQNSNVFIDHANTNEDASTSWLGLSGGNPLFKFGLNWKHQQLPLDSSKDAVLIGIGIDQSLIPFIPRLNGISLGTTLGKVNEKIAGSSADSYLVDVGALWRGEIGQYALGVGAVIKNIYFGGLTFEGGTEEENWPQELRGGLSLTRWGLTGLLDFSAVDSEIEPRYGLEYGMGKFFQLRAGYDETIRYGIGVKYKNLGLAFGYEDGDIQSKPSGSISYTWGPKEEVDYTNPLTELEAKHQNLESYLIVEVRSDIQSGEKLELNTVLRLLAVSPNNDDAWVLLNSLVGEKRFRANIPQAKRARRDYLSFAVAFANGDPGAGENARLFLKKYPSSKVARIIRLIQKYVPELQNNPVEEKP
jgi:hypothetical protein